MASATNWSVVGKPKKGKAPGLTKTQKKQFIDNMPRIEALDPVQESSTIYDALQQRYEKKQQERFADKIESSRENAKGISDGVSKKKVAPKAKKTEVSKKTTFEEAVKKVSEEDLKSVLLQSKGHFPKKPELWLKDLVTYLNVTLENCVHSDKYLQRENTDFPASSLKKGCTRVLTSALHDCSQATLEHVLYFCVNSMLVDNNNGLATYGYKIFIQLLVRSNPQIVLSKLQQYKDLVKSTLNRPDRCLSVLWAVGQVGFSSLTAALRVWLELMFPYIGVKSLGGYCMQYLEIILSLHNKNLDKSIGEIKMKEYFAIFDQMYSASLPTDVRRRLLALHPQIKRLAISESVESAHIHNFFSSFLARVSSNNTEVLQCLTECLSVDKQSFSLWCQVYLKQLTQSRIFLSYLVANWGKLPYKLDEKLMQQTLMTFIRTNEQSGHIKNVTELTEMTNLCEGLLKLMAQPRFPWRWVLFFLFSTVMAVILYDVYTSKAVRDCKIMRFLEMYGVLAILQQTWDLVCSYSNLTIRWLQVNVPVYYSQAYMAVSPLVANVKEYLINLELNTRDVRHNFTTKVYELAPDVWDLVGHYLLQCQDFILEYTYWIQGHIAVLYKQLYHWVDLNIVNGNYSSENIRQTITWSASKVQNLTISLMQWWS